MNTYYDDWTFVNPEEYHCECDYLIYVADDDTILFPKDIVPNIIDVIQIDESTLSIVIQCPKCEKVHRLTNV